MIVHVNQIVYVILSVLITGRYAVIDVAKRVAVADRKSSIGIGIVSEREHCGTNGRAEDRKFVWGNCGYREFHVAKMKSKRYAKNKNSVQENV